MGKSRLGVWIGWVRGHDGETQLVCVFVSIYEYKIPYLSKTRGYLNPNMEIHNS